MLDCDWRCEPLDAIRDELHDDWLAVDLLHLALAVPKSHRRRRPLAAFANWALPGAAEVVFQTFGGTLHGESTNDQEPMTKQIQKEKGSNGKYSRFEPS